MKSSHLAPNAFIRGSRVRAAAAALAWSSAGAALAIGVAVPAHAQQVNASLRGTITAEGGASQVTAVNVNTGLTRTATVSENGVYQIASLPPGTYRLEVTTPSGVRKTDEFQLLVAQNAVLDFDLTAPVTTADTGAADEILITSGRIRSMEGGEVGVNITQREIDTLPQNNRNFLAFADLAPGVQFITGSNGNARLQGGAQDSRTVNVFIDGVGQKDYVLKNGVTGQDSSEGNPFPQSAIGEYKVLSSNYKAEFDQVSSVAITAVTRSGTNEFKGDAFFEYYDESFRTRTPIERDTNAAKTSVQDMQFGASLGGPIIKDKLHFFVTYEGKRIERPIDIFPGNSANNANIPSAVQNEFGSFSRIFNEDLFFGKLSFQPTDRDLIEGSVKVRLESGDGIGSGSNLRDTASNSKVEEYRGTFRWEHSADTWVNDLKLTYEDARWAPTPAVFGPQFAYQDANGVQIYRTGGGSNYQDKGQKGWGIQNDFTWTGAERHTVKAGVKAKWVDLNSLQLNLFNPVYFYNTQYNGAAWNNTQPFRVQFGFDPGLGADPIVQSKNFQLGLYIQDDWQATEQLTLNLGLRWDYDRTPAWVDFVHPAQAVAAVSPANYPNLNNANYNINDYISTGKERKTFTGAFQPRLGFTYMIDEESNFAIFGGYGRSYDRNQFDFIQQETSVGGFSTRTFNFLVPGDTRNNCTPSATCVAWNPIYATPEGRAQLVNSVGPQGGAELRFINNDLKTPYSDQFSLGIRRQFGLLETELGFSHIKSRDGFVWLLGNRRPDGSFFAPTGNQSSPFGNPPPGRGSIILGDNGLETSANSAYVKLTKRYTQSSPWNVTATYTYTDAEENRQFGETFSLDFPSINDYPTLRSAGVARHRLVMAGSVDLPFGIVFSSKLRLETAPYLKGFNNTATGVRIIQGIEGNNQNPFILGDWWAFRQLDVAVTKYVPLKFLSETTKLRLRVDALNILNTYNFNSYNSNPRDVTADANGVFGDIANRGIGGNLTRTIKLSAGISF
ncbi:outer membrane receptor protein involved in Fe transport [Sphingomonas sp. BE123]|uniref:TonB-dependent receptor n=1 Tax=Sphingomonas sp. BE123 TaxID=2817842 RepID=UPI0028545D1F|nr:TonB-dependent receptor [Sphingomonas sp. BE123]MDR6851283.1 outer membrane receptor protein involved in Fe transport [Sphingomonas sp. BE123]